MHWCSVHGCSCEALGTHLIWKCIFITWYRCFPKYFRFLGVSLNNKYQNISTTWLVTPFCQSCNSFGNKQNVAYTSKSITGWFSKWMILSSTTPHELNATLYRLGVRPPEIWVAKLAPICGISTSAAKNHLVSTIRFRVSYSDAMLDPCWWWFEDAQVVDRLHVRQDCR